MRRLWAGLMTGLVGLAGGGTLILQAYAGSAPTQAAPLMPWSSQAQRGATQTALNNKSGQAASHFAQSAIAAMPIDQFALAASSSGKTPQQQLAILNLAAALGWRDPATNIALVRAAMREGEPVIAAQRLDALGRTVGPEAALPFVDTLIQMDGGIAALSDRAKMRAGGSWWQGYFRSEPETREIAQQRSALLQRFDREDGAWLNTTIRDAAIGFAKGGHDDLTMEVWRASLASDAEFAGPIYDPKFTAFNLSARAVGGEWEVSKASPALISKGDAGGIIIERERTDTGPILSQEVAIPSGRWALQIEGSESGKPDLEWRISCRGKGRLPLETTATAAFQFTAPETCKTLTLTLFAAPKTSAEAGTLDLRRVTMARAE